MVIEVIVPSELVLTSPSLIDFRADAGELVICLPAQMPGSLTQRPSRLCPGSSSSAEAATNADSPFVWVGGIEGKWLPGMNRRASLAR